MSIYDSKLLIFCFCPENDELKWSDILVYSYLAYQDRYGNAPTNNRLAYLTGLSNSTVEDSRRRLEEWGLLMEGKPVPKTGWFRTVHKEGSEHWSKTHLFWRCLVKAEDSPLSATDTMVYSYLLDKAENNFSPSSGWSDEYLGKCLRMSPKTIASCLERLEQNGLFRAEDFAVANVLRGPQASWFKTKDTTKPKAKSNRQSLGTFEPDLSDYDPDVKPTARVEPAKVAPKVVDCAARDAADKLALMRHIVIKYIGEQVPHSKAGNAVLKAVHRRVIVDGELAPDWRSIVNAEVSDLAV